MADDRHLAFKVSDRSYFALLKKDIHVLSVAAGFSTRRVGEVDIVVAELVSNLVKHAGGGQLLVKRVVEDGLQGIELIAIDNGPGIADVARMMTDGVSTKNTLGHGLGAMKRLADLFQVFSQKDWGTVQLLRLFESEHPPYRKKPRIEVRSIVVPKPGETACGDAFYFQVDGEQVRLLLGDGLGHGPEAQLAADTAGKDFLECTDTDPVDVVRSMNAASRKTRGLVATTALFSDRSWKLCGVGNIATRLCDASNSRNYMPYNGIIGLNVPNTLNPLLLPYEKGQFLILCSDGIKTRWDLARYPGLMRYDGSVVCAVIYKDFARHTDDMSVAYCKINL